MLILIKNILILPFVFFSNKGVLCLIPNTGFMKPNEMNTFKNSRK